MNGEDDTIVEDPQQKASAAAALAEQMRLEEEALTAARGPQEAEAALLESGYRAGIRPPAGPTEFGQVAPTSSGFMYIGNPVNAPAVAARPVPPAQANIPAPPPGRLTPTDIAYSPASQQFADRVDYERAVNVLGVPPEKALSMYPGVLGGIGKTAQGALLGVQPAGQRPIYRNIGGRLVRIDQMADTATDVTPPSAVKQDVPQWVRTAYSDIVKADREAQANAAFDPGAANRSRWAREKFEAEHFGGAAPGGSVVTPPKREVTRKTKDGRMAVYDADTKKFLRYAR